jgi:hypothetical protein
VQKKRCPFFFFDGRESLFTLSLSESMPSLSSPISTSCEDSAELFERCEFSLLMLPRASILLSERECEDVNGPDGSGF